ncbi:hypothetical protein BJ878DRAFT_500989 [Calycina marina]|uniref:Uncharacterized protein n=1 Tax=Calycina marina TaxID=1763456 RepID=A0A9P8CG83_9HELO|nr:hypothetical protein BJ878DRAFT_500989 [Calycina marina]
MKDVTFFCSKCKTALESFRNDFIGRGSTYFPPLQPLVHGDIDGFELTGDTYLAAAESQVERSVFQNLACRECKAVLGMRCDNVLDENLLRKDQLLLGLAHITVLYKDGKTKADVVVKDRLRCQAKRLSMTVLRNKIHLVKRS